MVNRDYQEEVYRKTGNDPQHSILKYKMHMKTEHFLCDSSGLVKKKQAL